MFDIIKPTIVLGLTMGKEWLCVQ